MPWVPMMAQSAAPPTSQPVDTVGEMLWQSVRASVEQTPWIGWATLLGGIAAGLLVGHGLRWLLASIATRLETRSRRIRAVAFRSAASPGAFLLLGIGTAFGLAAVKMSDPVRAFSLKCFALYYIVVVGWFLFNLIDVVDLSLRRLTARRGHHNGLDQTLVPLVRRTLRLFLILVLALFTLENVFNRDVSAWLAGLGIAGLAISFAAQDSIKNLFGSLTILFDRPFRVGDLITIDAKTGHVEDIGFRSTKLRMADGAVATVPNSKVVEQSVVNASRRRSQRRAFEIAIAPIAATEFGKAGRLVEAVRSVLTRGELAERVEQTPTPGVRLEGFGGSLALRVHYTYQSIDETAFAEHAARVDQAIRDALAANEIGLR